ncbi:hypothetical protein C8R47DRAFT_1064307 [Mycena vitilis]|nr:hypothetical protein C8R47DRAFT_1064307 [Mycena vitilis]
MALPEGDDNSRDLAKVAVAHAGLPRKADAPATDFENAAATDKDHEDEFPDLEDIYADMPGLDDLSDDDIPELIPALPPLLQPSGGFPFRCRFHGAELVARQDMRALQVFQRPGDAMESVSALNSYRGKPLPVLIWMDGNFRLMRRREMANESLRMGEPYHNLGYDIAHPRPCADWQRGEFWAGDGEGVEHCGWSKRHCILHNHDLMASSSDPPVFARKVVAVAMSPKKVKTGLSVEILGQAGAFIGCQSAGSMRLYAVAGMQIKAVASNSKSRTTYSLNVGNAWVMYGCIRGLRTRILRAAMCPAFGVRLD